MSEDPLNRPGHYVPQSWPAPVRGLAAVSRFLGVLEGLGIGLCLLSLVVLATWQFLERNLTQRHLPFFAVPVWIDGVIRHSVFLLGFLGGAYATFTARHIRIDAVTRAIPPRRRMALRILSTLAAMFIVSLLCKAAWGFYLVTTEEAGDASQVGQIFTSSRGAMIIVVGYAVVLFHFALQILIDLCWLVSGKEPPPGWIAEASGH